MNKPRNITSGFWVSKYGGVCTNGSSMTGGFDEWESENCNCGMTRKFNRQIEPFLFYLQLTTIWDAL